MAQVLAQVLTELSPAQLTASHPNANQGSDLAAFREQLQALGVETAVSYPVVEAQHQSEMELVEL